VSFVVYEKGEEVEINIPEVMNVAEILIDENVRLGKGNKVALRCCGDEVSGIPESEYTYEELMLNTNRAGNALRNVRLDVDDRILMIALDTPEFVFSFFGAIKIGAIPVPVNTMLSSEEYLYYLNDSRAKAVIVHANLAEKVVKIAKKARFLKHIIVIETEKYAAENGQLSLSALMDEASDELEPLRLSRDAMAFWLYSSGTTGLPKGVVHLQHDMLYSADTYYRHVLELNEADVCYSVSKLFFAYGLGNSTYGPFRFGSEVVLDPAVPDPERSFQIIEKYGVTVLFTVPPFYNRMLAIEDAEKRYDTSSLRLCVNAGEALPAVTYQKWKEKFGVDILDGIGTTELTHIFISNRPGRIKPGTSGIPVPGYELKLVDDEGNDVPVGKPGKLLVKGDSIAALYWEKHEKTKKAFLGEWFDTGDMYVRDEDGFWTHVGRADDLIKTRGLWVSPVEVESALLKHPAVEFCAVVQGYDENRVGIVKAFVVISKDYTPSDELEEELRSFLKSSGLKGYKIPESFEFVDELPMTATGKIQRYKLRLLERERAFGKI
jgi:benzoate-CoA ligase